MDRTFIPIESVNLILQNVVELWFNPMDRVEEDDLKTLVRSEFNRTARRITTNFVASESEFLYKVEDELVEGAVPRSARISCRWVPNSRNVGSIHGFHPHFSRDGIAMDLGDPPHTYDFTTAPEIVRPTKGDVSWAEVKVQKVRVYLKGYDTMTGDWLYGKKD